MWRGEATAPRRATGESPARRASRKKAGGARAAALRGEDPQARVWRRRRLRRPRARLARRRDGGASAGGRRAAGAERGAWRGDVGGGTADVGDGRRAAPRRRWGRGGSRSRAPGRTCAARVTLVSSPLAHRHCASSEGELRGRGLAAAAAAAGDAGSCGRCALEPGGHRARAPPPWPRSLVLGLLPTRVREEESARPSGRGAIRRRAASRSLRLRGRVSKASGLLVRSVITFARGGRGLGERKFRTGSEAHAQAQAQRSRRWHTLSCCAPWPPPPRASALPHSATRPCNRTVALAMGDGTLGDAREAPH